MIKYKAIGDGKIWLKDANVPAETIRLLDGIFDYVDIYRIDDPFVYVTKNMTSFNEVGMYDEKETFMILEELAPYTQAAMINLNDGEDHFWRLSFKNGKWIKEEGAVVYTIDEARQFINRHSA